MKMATALGVMLLAASAVHAQDCFDYAMWDDPYLGAHRAGNLPNELAVADGRLCYAIPSAGGDILVWCDVSVDPVPVPLGSIFLAGSPVYGIRVVDSRVAVSRLSGGWLVVDFAVPSSPQVIGAVPGVVCTEVDLVGEFVYAAEHSGGLAIYSLVPGAEPGLIRRYDDGYVGSVDLDAGRCWFSGQRDWVEGDPGAYYEGFQVLVVLDVTVPDAPVEVGRREIQAREGWTEDLVRVRADGPRAAILHSAGPWPEGAARVDLEFHDIYGFPSIPVRDSFSVGTFNCNYSIAGDWAHLVFDSRTRYLHHDLQGWREVGQTMSGGRHSASSAGGLWVASGVNILALGSTRPLPSPHLSNGYQSAAQPLTLHSVDGHLLLLETDLSCDHCPPPRDRLMVLDTTEPLDPRVVLTPLEGPQGALAAGIAVDGDLVYSHLGIVNWRTGVMVGSFSPPSGSVLAVVGDVVWSRSAGDVLLHDAADPAAPVSMGRVLTGDDVALVAVSDERAVCANSTTLIVMDVSDPLDPVELRRVAHSGGTTLKMILDGSTLLVADAGGLGVYRLTVDGTPTLVSRQDLGWILDLAIDGNILYAAVRWVGVLVMDVSDPEHPMELGRAEVGTYPAGLAIHEGLLYVSDTGLQVWRLHCNTPSPILLRELESAFVGGECVLTWRFVGDAPAPVRLLATAGGRSRVVPWRLEGGRCVAVDTAARPGETVAYAVQVADDGGWTTLREQTIVIPGLVQALYAPAPNPFNPKTELRFVLDRDGMAHLSVYDVAGRRVRILATGRHEAGTYTCNWNGCDDDGRPLPSGPYFFRLETPQSVQTAKAMLLR